MSLSEDLREAVLLQREHEVRISSLEKSRDRWLAIISGVVIAVAGGLALFWIQGGAL